MHYSLSVFNNLVSFHSFSLTEILLWIAIKDVSERFLKPEVGADQPPHVTPEGRQIFLSLNHLKIRKQKREVLV